MDVDAPAVIVEGKAHISQKSGVFYNKVQEFNRDLRYGDAECIHNVPITV